MLCALVGIALAIAAVVIFEAMSRRGVISADVQTPLSYLVTWVPMAGAVIVYIAMRPRNARATLRWGIRWIDLLWGAALGIACRMIAIVTSLAVYGNTGLGQAPTIGGAVDPWLVFGALIAPIVIAPVIEELFFRGLALGSLYDEVGGAKRRGASAAIAIVVTTVLFTAVHLIGVPTEQAAIATAVPVFVLGAALAGTTLATGRIGAAIIGHVVFNGIAAVIAYPW